MLRGGHSTMEIVKFHKCAGRLCPRLVQTDTVTPELSTEAPHHEGLVMKVLPFWGPHVIFYYEKPPQLRGIKQVGKRH